MNIILPLNKNQNTFLFNDEKLCVVVKVETIKLDNGFYIKMLLVGFYDNEPCNFFIKNAEHEESALRIIYKHGEWAGVVASDNIKFKAGFIDQI